MSHQRPTSAPSAPSSAAAASALADAGRPNPPAWLMPLRANWWVPLAIAALFPLGWYVEGGWMAGENGPLKAVDPFWARISILLGINLTLALSLQLINGIAGQFSLGHAGFMAVGAYLGGFAVSAYGGREPPGGDFREWANPGGVLLYFLSLVGLTAVSGAVLWGLYRLVVLTGRLHRRLPAALAWVLIAYLAADVLLRGKGSDGTYPLGAVNALSAAVSLLTGSYAWLMSQGAAPATWLSELLPASWAKPACFLMSLLGGGVTAAIAGFIVGLPTLRLKGDYLAIATLGFAQLIVVAIMNSAPLGRATGLSVPPYATEADPEIGLAEARIFPWVYAVALLTLLTVWRIRASPKGRAMQCLREDEIAAAAVGIDVTAHKVLAFVVGAFFAGIAGALFAHYDGYLNPRQFELTRSIELVVMVTLGGLGSIVGTLIAATVLTLFQPILQTAGDWMPSWMPAWTTTVTDAMNRYRLVIYALLLIVAMLARSRGWLDWRRPRRPATPPPGNPPPGNPPPANPAAPAAAGGRS